MHLPCTHSSHSTVKSRPMEDTGMARAVHIITITTRLELGTDGKASVEMVVRLLHANMEVMITNQMKINSIRYKSPYGYHSQKIKEAPNISCPVFFLVSL
jgi:hypothetical protein